MFCGRLLGSSILKGGITFPLSFPSDEHETYHIDMNHTSYNKVNFQGCTGQHFVAERARDQNPPEAGQKDPLTISQCIFLTNAIPANYLGHFVEHAFRVIWIN